MREGECPPFYATSGIRVIKSGEVDFEIRPTRFPKTETKMSFFELVCLKLAKEGYFEGNPEIIAKIKVSWILKTFDYMNFQFDFKEEMRVLNK